MGFKGLQGNSFPIIQNVQTGSGDHTDSNSAGNGGSFGGARRTGGECDHSPASNAEPKNKWSCTFTSPYASCREDSGVEV